MKRISVVLFALYVSAFCISPNLAAQTTETFRQEGIASWYGPEFDGRPTASGEIFNSSLLTAAHPTLPFGTMLRVTNRHNNKQVTVKVNDRGPFFSARIIDVSKAAAELLDMLVTGTAPVLIESTDRIALSSGAVTAETDPYWTAPPSEPQPFQSEAPAPVYNPVPQTPVYVPPVEPVTTYAPNPSYPSATSAPPAATSTPSPSTEYPPATAFIPPVPEYSPAPVAAPVQTPSPIPLPPARLTPVITPAPDKVYRLQVGSYKVARNAVESFDKLKKAGLNPAYERNGDYFRVVLAGIRGTDVQSALEKIGQAGFREALIREER